jgi:hypothetical protein
VQPFGRDKYHPDQLTPFIRDAFTHLRRTYFDTHFARVHDRIMSMTDIDKLLELHTELKSLLFGTNVTGIVVARLQQLTPGHGGLQVFRFPSTAKCVAFRLSCFLAN